jgi:hypothetical protein
LIVEQPSNHQINPEFLTQILYFYAMAKVKPVKQKDGKRKASYNPKTELWVKRDASSGAFTKASKKSFKGISREALKKLTPVLNRLAKYDKENS